MFGLGADEQVTFEIEPGVAGHVDAAIDPAVGRRAVKRMVGIVGRVGAEKTGGERVTLPVGAPPINFASDFTTVFRLIVPPREKWDTRCSLFDL
jgi:hypothetical protein